MCERRARQGAVVPRTQATSPTTARCRRLSPRWSALWAPHHPEPRPHCPEPWPHCPGPRPHRTQTEELHLEGRTVELAPRRGRQQTGGIAPIEARHAGDTPKGGSSWCKTPSTARNTPRRRGRRVGEHGRASRHGPSYGTRGRRPDNLQTNVARNFPRSLFETTRKRCNSNGVDSIFELIAWELRARLMGGGKGLAEL